MSAALPVFVLLLCSAAPPPAQEPEVLVLEGRVVAADGGNAEIDRGRVDGLREGDLVRFLRSGAGEERGEVVALTARTATVRISGLTTALELGTPWEARIPSSRLTDAPSAESGQPHPAWEAPVGAWPVETPLLAPAAALGPADREPRFFGRVYAMTDAVRDAERNVNSLYLRGGADLLIENPFGQGGSLQAEGEYTRFSTSSPGQPDEIESGFRLDRLAYAHGGDRAHPLRWEVGRFLHSEFPEFGVLDGVELGYRFGNGHRAGASAGYLPRLYGDLQTGEDFQSALFYRAVVGERGESSLGAGIQKTWHEGESDRDLLVLQASHQPREGFYAYASAWLDSYGSDAVAKSGSLELTRLIASGGHRDAQGDGWMLTLSSFRFPELLVDPADPVTPPVLSDGEVRRADLMLHRNLSARGYGSVRASYWQDDEESGAGGDLRYELRGWPLDRSRAGASLFANQGRFSDVLGARLDGSWSSDFGAWSLMWETAQHAQHDVVGAQERLLQHRARAGWDLSLRQGWSLSLYFEQQSGDELSAQTTGFYLQKSF